MNEISARLKTLRANRNMTQTDVANALGVTTQAVSRWESQTTLPDIALLIPIADFYGVSIDYLLGHDLSEKEEEILNYLEYCKSSSYRGNSGNLNELIAKTRGMLRKHPSDHRIMLELCSELFELYEKFDKKRKHLEELLEWGEIIMNHSVDSSLRYQTTKLIIYSYYELGMYETVKKLVDGLPDFSESRDALRYFCAPSGTKEALQNEKSLAYKCFDNICSCMLKFGTDIDTMLLTTKEKISICQTVANMVFAYFPAEDYDGFALEYLYRAEIYTSLFFAMENNEKKALEHLNKALLSFEKIDTISSVVLKTSYSSPFLCGLPAPHGCPKERYKKIFLSVTDCPCFERIKNNEVFKNIEKRFMLLSQRN